MKIINSEWTPQVNMLAIECDCGRQFSHRADRWKIECPICHRTDNLAFLRKNISIGDIIND